MAADYSQMSMEELNSLRGKVPVENRDAFRAEMQSRMKAMTPQERAKYRQERGNMRGQGLGNGSGMGKGKGNGQGMKQRLRDGSGAGGMHQGVNRGQGQGTKAKLKDGSGGK